MQGEKQPSPKQPSPKRPRLKEPSPMQSSAMQSSAMQSSAMQSSPMQSSPMQFISPMQSGRIGIWSIPDMPLLRIFKSLDAKDLISLGVACQRLRGTTVRNELNRKYEKVAINRKTFEKSRFIYSFFFYYGWNVTWLKINFNGFNPRLIDIICFCRNLKNFEIVHWQGEDSTQIGDGVSQDDLKHIELLSLARCDLGKLEKFLENFKKLKFLSIAQCFAKREIMLKLMEVLLGNNPDLESFCCIYTDNFNIDLLKKIPKVERLALDIRWELNYYEMMSLGKLNRLTKLRIDRNPKSTVEIRLKPLLLRISYEKRHTLMEEMEFINVEVDYELLNTLHLYSKVELLAIKSTGIFEVTERPNQTSLWPRNVKRLDVNFTFTREGFLATIKELKSLERMDIFRGSIAEADAADFKIITGLSTDIIDVMNIGYRPSQRLGVVLPLMLFDDNEETQMMASNSLYPVLYKSTDNQLTILREGDYDDAVLIHFPGLDDL